MERHFVLPATIAAAMHGLLFGLPRGHVAEMPPEPIPVVDPGPKPPVIEISSHTDETDATAPSGGATAEIERKIDAPQSSDPKSFIVPVERQSVTKLTPGVYKIDGPLGPPNGNGVGFDRSGIVASIALDHTPQTRVQISPEYPYQARHDGRAGDVVVEFVVDESGNVTSPHVVRSSDAIFNDPALRAVRKWRFQPGTVNGQVVRFRMALPLQFRLDN